MTVKVNDFTVVFMIDIDEKLTVSELLSQYGKILTPHQAEMMRLYYDCDISLFEIATESGISRQAVRDAIQRGVKTLKDIDEKLNCIDKNARIRDDLQKIIESVKCGDTASALDFAEKAVAVLEE